MNLAYGQTKYFGLQGKNDPKMNEYWEVVDHKVSALYVGALKTGCLLGEGSDEQMDLLENFGSALGQVYHLRKDVLEFEAVDVLGKDANSFIHRGKRNLVTIHALNELDTSKREELLNILNKKGADNTSKDIERALELIDSVNSVDYVQGKAKHIAESAKHLLKELPETRAKYVLEGIVDAILHMEN